MAAHPLQVQRAQTVGVAAYIDFRIYQGSRNTPSGPCKLSSTDSRRKHFGSSPHLYFFRVNMKSTLGLSLLLAATTSVPVCAVSLTATTFSKCYTVRASTSVKSASTVSSTIIYTRPVTQYTTITPTSTVTPAQGASVELCCVVRSIDQGRGSDSCRFSYNDNYNLHGHNCQHDSDAGYRKLSFHLEVQLLGVF